MSLSINAHNALSDVNTWATLAASPWIALNALENLVLYQSKQKTLSEAEKIHDAVAAGCKILKHLKLLPHAQREKVKTLKALSKQQKKVIRSQEQHITPKLIRPLICTAEVKTMPAQMKLKKIAQKWQRTAHAQQACSSLIRPNALSHSSLQIINDCEWTAGKINSFLPKNVNRTSDGIYVAYLTNKTVLGIMLTSNSPKNHSIDFIVSNPKAQNLLKIQKTTLRGTATALIRHYAQDVLKQKELKKKTLSLSSLASALPVYRHLGFTGPGWNMTLTKKKMEGLVQNSSCNHLPQTEEPDSLRL